MYIYIERERERGRAKERERDSPRQIDWDVNRHQVNPSCPVWF